MTALSSELRSVLERAVVAARDAAEEASREAVGRLGVEVDKAPEGKFSARKPMISSLRRNLQREYIDRLIDVAHPTTGNAPASKTLATLARMYLTQVNGKIEKALKAEPDVLDPYTKAHLQDANNRITKALDATFTINSRDQGLRSTILFFGENARIGEACNHPGCSCAGSGWRRTEKADE